VAFRLRRHREEKGSVISVAAQLLVDVLTGVVDAAMVTLNDSDLGALSPMPW